MNLKTLISIKFVLHFIFIIISVYLSNNIHNTNSILDEQTNLLLEQKKNYEQVVKLDGNNLKEKERLLTIIKNTDDYLKPQSLYDKKKRTNQFLILIVFILFSFFTITLLNEKIDKLKSLESEEEKLQLL
jgi:hypothetical protein